MGIKKDKERWFICLEKILLGSKEFDTLWIYSLRTG